LPAALKERLDIAVQKADISVHALMIQTLSESIDRSQLREAFSVDSATALREMSASAKGYELSAVRQYFDKMAAYRNGLSSSQ
jgi:hypothetical protein